MVPGGDSPATQKSPGDNRAPTEGILHWASLYYQHSEYTRCGAKSQGRCTSTGQMQSPWIDHYVSVVRVPSGCSQLGAPAPRPAAPRGYPHYAKIADFASPLRAAPK